MSCAWPPSTWGQPHPAWSRCGETNLPQEPLRLQRRPSCPALPWPQAACPSACMHRRALQRDWLTCCHLLPPSVLPADGAGVRPAHGAHDRAGERGRGAEVGACPRHARLPASPDCLSAHLAHAYTPSCLWLAPAWLACCPPSPPAGWSATAWRTTWRHSRRSAGRRRRRWRMRCSWPSGWVAAGGRSAVWMHAQRCPLPARHVQHVSAAAAGHPGGQQRQEAPARADGHAEVGWWGAWRRSVRRNGKCLPDAELAPPLPCRETELALVAEREAYERLAKEKAELQLSLIHI